MVTPSGIGSVPPVGGTKQIQPSHDREVYTPTIQSPNYDSVSLSQAPTGESRFHRDMVSRLSQEIRTNTTIRDIQTLREEVSAGTYKPDPMAIAARILLLGEDM